MWQKIRDVQGSCEDSSAKLRIQTLPENSGNVKQQVICIYKGQSESFIEYSLDGGQPGSKKIS